MSLAHNDNGDSTEFEIARLAGELAQEVGALYAIKCLRNISRALEPMVEPPVVRSKRMLTMTAEVALKHGFTLYDLIGRSKKGPVCRARHEAFARLYALRGEGRDDPFSLPSIGAFFGRDHTTILSGLRKHGAEKANRR